MPQNRQGMPRGGLAWKPRGGLAWDAPKPGGNVTPYGFGFVTDTGTQMLSGPNAAPQYPTIQNPAVQPCAQAFKEMWHALDERETATKALKNAQDALTYNQNALAPAQAKRAQAVVNLSQAQDSPWWNKAAQATAAYNAAAAKGDISGGGKSAASKAANIAKLKKEMDKWVNWQNKYVVAFESAKGEVQTVKAGIAAWESQLPTLATARGVAIGRYAKAKQWVIKVCAPLHPNVTEYVKFNMWEPSQASAFGYDMNQPEWEALRYSSAMGRLWYLSDKSLGDSKLAEALEKTIADFERQLKSMNAAREGLRGRVDDLEQKLKEARGQREAAAAAGDTARYAVAKQKVEAANKAYQGAKADLRARIRNIATRTFNLTQTRAKATALRTTSKIAMDAFHKRRERTGIDAGPQANDKVTQAKAINAKVGLVILRAGDTVVRVITSIGETIAKYDLGDKLGETTINTLVDSHDLAKKTNQQVVINSPELLGVGDDDGMPGWLWAVAAVAIAVSVGVV